MQGLLQDETNTKKHWRRSFPFCVSFSERRWIELYFWSSTSSSAPLLHLLPLLSSPLPPPSASSSFSSSSSRLRAVWSLLNLSETGRRLRRQVPRTRAKKGQRLVELRSVRGFGKHCCRARKDRFSEFSVRSVLACCTQCCTQCCLHAVRYSSTWIVEHSPTSDNGSPYEPTD